MSANGKSFWRFLVALAAIFLAGLACVVVPTVQKMDCEASGGQWKHDSHLNYDYCENPGPEYTRKYSSPTQAALPEPGTSSTATTPVMDRDACNATRSLQVSHEITVQETNQFGTRACEYTLIVHNMSDTTGVWAYFYQHDRDGYAHTENSRWMGNLLIEPGGEARWTASIYIYSDKDADGPLMSIPEKIAGVANNPECAKEKQDLDFFESIAVPLEPACPLE